MTACLVPQIPEVGTGHDDNDVCRRRRSARCHRVYTVGDDAVVPASSTTCLAKISSPLPTSTHSSTNRSHCCFSAT
ncbi:hypothetical protein L596_006568 [Steinernema carpocapsae]|uniref:Uncharacterized protein n=1 Tax=Steinernema carpocapsae TaxID=34508 RepID=A0A4U8V2G2_STECR|nr:hypothetical protein L596_006568 [Steinernema carpocapsae]